MPHGSCALVLVFLLAAALIACAVPAASTPTTVPAPAAAPTAATASAPVSADTTELVVFAAASLTESFTEIGKSFEASNSGTRVTYSFAGSNDLAAQIAKGAPADVFASAGTAQMQVVVKSGQIAT